jgi:hypothetical protein
MVATRSPSRNDSCLGIVLDTLLDQTVFLRNPGYRSRHDDLSYDIREGSCAGQSAYNLAEMATNLVQGSTLSRMRVKSLDGGGLAYP